MNRLFNALNSIKARLYGVLGIDAAPPIPPELSSQYPSLDTRTVTVFVSSTLLLVVFYLYGRTSAFYSYFEEPLLRLVHLDSFPHSSLLGFLYWGIASVSIRIGIPSLIILFFFRDPLRDYGYRLPEKGHWIIYAILYLFMVPIIFIASNSASFHLKYPFYGGAGDSWTQFLLYESAYVLQFFAVEAFFRGFVLFGLFKKLGYNAIFIMTIPYCMIHFGKPPAEVFGSIIAGIALGYLALESKSWLPGAWLHAAVGLTMDSLALMR